MIRSGTICGFTAAWTMFCFTALADSTGLRVDGADFVSNSQKIMLRGVAVGDALLARADRPLEDFQVIATDWHANVVRIDIHPTVWKHQKHAKVLAELERQTEAATRAGMFAIIDWHTIGWPDGYLEKPQPEWGDPNDLYDTSFSLVKSFGKKPPAVSAPTHASFLSFGMNRFLPSPATAIRPIRNGTS